TLHHVEWLRPDDVNVIPMTERGFQEATMKARSLLSLPEYQRLRPAPSGVRQTAGIRGEVVVRRPGQAAAVWVARFTDAAFFSLFDRTFERGGPWDAAGDGGGASVLVLGKGMADTLFPDGGAVGQLVEVDGTPYRVVGTLARHQPLNAPWQLLLNGGLQDALFLPWGDFDRLGALPFQPLYRSPVGADRAALLSSGALFVSHWVDLPNEDVRGRYARFLDTVVGPGRYVLRSLPEWRQAFALPMSIIAFFNFMGAVVLCGGAFSLGRWLMMKGLLRAGEWGVFRAVGAPRGSLFWRVLAEAALITTPAALVAPLLALPIIAYFNHSVRVVDIPLSLNGLGVALSIAGPLLLNLIGACYPAWRLSRTPPTMNLGTTG
ncbi:MAG TPA: ABC transporter permease, partial [Polyangia bacterium]|nr:ABC transporter permease [Polyangia bacterium]